MLQYLLGVSHVNLCKRTQLTKPIYMLFSKIGEDKIMRIKSYSANKLSKLTDMQIDTIKNHLTTQREKNSRTHVTSEMITTTTSLSLGRMTSEKIVNASQTIPAEVPAFSQPNKNMPAIPYDACAPYINVALKEYPYLSLFNSDGHNDGYEFKNSGLCPECGKEHNKGKVVGRGIKGSYYIKCRSSPNEKEIRLPENSSDEKLSDVEMSTSVKSQVSVPFTSSSDQISKSNKSRLLASILPEDS